MTRLLKLLAGLTLLGALSSTAYAGPIVGTLGYFGGFVSRSGPGGATVNLAHTNYLDFFSPTMGFGTGMLPTFTTSLFLQDFSIDPFVAPQLVWTEGMSGISFTLKSLVIEVQTINFLTLSGTGIFSKAGFDNTMGVWSLTAQDTTGGAAPILTFSASTAVATPEPGGLLLLGLALTGLGLARRTRFHRATR